LIPQRANGYRELDRRRIVGLLWVYLALLIAEGALRKWFLPSLSDVLLISRDPVALAIIALAVRGGFFVINPMLRAFLWLAVGFVVMAAVQLTMAETAAGPVIGFGLRTYLLHPPLIFVMAQVLDARDLRRMALGVIYLMLPIAALMVLQFQAAPGDWINRGAGDGRQLLSALGRVRPAGPFSFITGPVLFFGLGMACVIGASFGRGRHLFIARCVGWGALLVAGAVSGSRAFVVGLAPVMIGAIVAMLARPQAAAPLLRNAIAAALVVTFLWSAAPVQEGLEVFTARMEITGTDDFLARAIQSYELAKLAWTDAPSVGVGLGLGTNAGTALLGASVFTFGEGEWSRVLFEAGPILGLAYLVWRGWLAVQLSRAALRAASSGYVFPILCLSAALTNILQGTWGQPTTQGFAVWTAGLALAACRAAAADTVEIPRYAARVHELAA
jgi:hypothetical protein